MFSFFVCFLFFDFVSECFFGEIFFCTDVWREADESTVTSYASGLAASSSKCPFRVSYCCPRASTAPRTVAGGSREKIRSLLSTRK